MTPEEINTASIALHCISLIARLRICEMISQNEMKNRRLA